MRNKIYLVFPHEKTSFVRLSISLLAVGTTLKEAGYDVQIVDMRFQDYENFDYSDSVFVGLTSFTGTTLKKGIEFSKYIKEKYPNVPVVWGGVHASILPEQTIREKYIDIIVRGEGDITAVELADVLSGKSKKKLNSIDGLTFKENGKIVHTKERKFVDMNKLPVPDYSLVDLSRAETTLGHFPYNGSRGCPHRCKFCFNLNFHHRLWRGVTAERAISDIKRIVKIANPRGIEFTEDNFFTSQERVRKIAQGILDNNLKLTMGASCRLDYLSKYDIEFLKLIKKAGWDLIAGGAESGSQRILDLLNKDIKVEDTLESVKKAKEAGIKLCLSFIYGVPGEKREDVLMTLDLIDKCRKIDKNVEVNGIFAFTIYLGDPLVEDCKKLGFVEPKSLGDWANHNLSDFNTQVWLSEKEKDWLKTIGHIIRFNYFNQTGRVYENLTHKWHYIPYIVGNFMFSVSAKFRWKFRFFDYAYEWKLWNWVKERYLGHF